jgi:hypothetical protein
VLTREEALDRIRDGLARWFPVDMATVRFVCDADVRYGSDEITLDEADLLDLSSDSAWAAYLDPSRRWLNATLLRTSEFPVIALRTGVPDRESGGLDADISIAVSMERLPVRLER